MIPPKATPAYSTGTTFLSWPRIQTDDIVAGMTVVGGVPSEFTGSAIGPRLGPAAIRESSKGIAWRWTEPGADGVVNVADGSIVRFRDDAKVGDIGDATIYAPQLEATTRSITDWAAQIVGLGAFPVMLGGDHYVSYPLVAGFHQAKRTSGQKRFGYIQIDAHLDLQDDNPTHGRYWHGSNARRVAELEGFVPSNMVWLGLLDIAWRDEWDFLQRNGATAVPVGAMRTRGIEQAVAEAIEIAARDCDSIYLSVDIDVCDNTAAPGTGYTNLGGLTSVEFLRVMKALGQSARIEAIDLVEVTPPRDVGGRTAYLAARGLVEFLRHRVLDPGHGDALIG